MAESDEYELMIRKAERSLQTACRISADGDYDFAISRAYYGVFYAMRAALESRGVKASKHGTTMSEFSRLFIKDGIFPSEFGALINQLFRRRQAGDYELSMVITRAEAQAALENAERIIRAVVDYLVGEGLLDADRQ